nr:MAG TPA: hypothetical protein [Caudoviricetes sp.]
MQKMSESKRKDKLQKYTKHNGNGDVSCETIRK